MKTALYPIVCHPSNVLLLDDDRKFMNLVASNLDEVMPFVMLEDPKKALDYLRSHVMHPSDLTRLVAQQSFDRAPDKEHLNADDYTINLSALKGDLSSAQRFKKVLVVVVDRRMPSMDGLDFCKLIREELQLPVKLILLTGATTSKEAITAFNEGKIDAFIEKRSSKSMIEKLNKTIQQLIWQQLGETSQKIIGLIEYQLSHIFDENFYKQFDKIRQENKTTEFYLLDSSGSFLMLDSKGVAKMLFVRTDEDFSSMYDLAKDSGALRDVLQALKDRQQFPFSTQGHNHSSVQGDGWDSLMVPMEKIPGRELFYSVVDLALPDTVGFDTYRDQIWPEP